MSATWLIRSHDYDDAAAAADYDDGDGDELHNEF